MKTQIVRISKEDEADILKSVSLNDAMKANRMLKALGIFDDEEIVIAKAGVVTRKPFIMIWRTFGLPEIKLL